MSPRRLALALLLVATASGQDASPEIRTVRPLGAGPGQVVSLELTGTGLGGPATIRFEAPGIRVDDLKSVDGKLDARVTLPEDVAPGPLRFRVLNGRGFLTPAGWS